jgi:hypothetical protein
MVQVCTGPLKDPAHCSLALMAGRAATGVIRVTPALMCPHDLLPAHQKGPRALQAYCPAHTR